MDDLILNIKAFSFYFFILRACQTECGEQDGEAHQIMQADLHFIQSSLQHAVSKDRMNVLSLRRQRNSFFVH